MMHTVVGSGLRNGTPWQGPGADGLSQVGVVAGNGVAGSHTNWMFTEGQAGAVAVALAAATASMHPRADRTALLDIADRLVPGQVRDLLVRAADLRDASPSEAGAMLGTGLRISAHDTVPYALWCAFGHLHDYRAAQLTAIAGFESAASDRDTICAIVGGIVAMSCADSTIPADWIAQREPLPEDCPATSFSWD